MELYILDDLLRRDTVIDNFESLIWTERFREIGDFEVKINSTYENRSRLKPDVRIAINESYRVMIIETVEDTTEDDGNKVLKIKGRSLELLLDSRVAKKTMSSLTLEPTWDITAKPADIMRQVVRDICILGKLDTADVITNLQEGLLLPASNIAEPIDPIVKSIEPQSVYDVVKELSEIWNLGFRILRNGDTSQLYFDVYAGSDRTSGQAALPAVIFAPELDNLQNTTELTTIEKARNVAYVFSPAGFKVVFATGVDPNVAGFDRHVLVVKADDITSDNPDPAAAMLQRGLDELAKNRAFQAFDGEINQSSQYKYGVDYHLGDLVEMRNTDGVMNQMRVTEQIFVSDKEGDRSYPTLAINIFINTGSWLSWESNQVWADLDTNTTLVWANA